VAQALGVQACRQRQRVLFTKTAALLTDLAGGRVDGSLPARLRRYLSPDLLILDDFAMREYSTSQAEDLAANSIIAGGMLPKLEACQKALKQGVGRVRILPATEAEALPQFYFAKLDCGTEVTYA